MFEHVLDIVDDGAHALHGRMVVVFPHCGQGIVNHLCAASVEVERTYHAKTSTVVGCILAFNLCPKFVASVVVFIWRDAAGAKVTGVAVAWEHEVAFGAYHILAFKAIASILHVVAVFPVAAQIVVIVFRFTGVTVRA